MGVENLGFEPGGRRAIGPRLADVVERARTAFSLLVLRWREARSFKKPVQSPAAFRNERAQAVINGHRRAAAGLPVEQAPLRNAGLERFLKTDRLRGELDFVGSVLFGFAPLVFHHHNPPVPVELDNIADAMQSESLAAHRKPARDPHTRTRFVRPVMRAVVHRAPLGGETVLRPLAVQVDQRALPLAKEQVLERGDRKGVHYITNGSSWRGG